MSFIKNISVGKLVASIIMLVGFMAVYNSQQTTYTFTTQAQEASKPQKVAVKQIENPFINSKIAEQDESSIKSLILAASDTDESSASEQQVQNETKALDPVSSTSTTTSTSSEHDASTTPPQNTSVKADDSDEITDSGPEVLIYLLIPLFVALARKNKFLFRIRNS